MRFRHSIRARIFSSYAALGAITGATLWLLTLFAFELWERELMDTFVTGELDYFVAETANTPGNLVKKSSTWTAYKITGDPLPPELTQLERLPPGIHEAVIGGRNLDVGITRKEATSYYFLYDDTHLEHLEDKLAELLLMAIGIAFLCAAAYGYRLSRRVIRPVTALADTIRSLDGQQLPKPEFANFADDEIGELARVFNSYLSRLAGFIRREQEFTADVSHELRTPLAAIRAMAEGLLARDDLPKDVAFRVGRMEKSAANMAEQLACLLVLARESSNPPTSHSATAVAPILAEVARDCRVDLRPNVTLSTQCLAEPLVAAAPGVVAIVIGNLLRNACSHTLGGDISVCLEGDGLHVADTGAGIRATDLAHVFERGFRGVSADTAGTGLGLSIVQRFCDLYGWHITITSERGTGTHVHWRFADRDPAGTANKL
ncbi:MAG: sensor histidine kinase [Porticoccaceae bacterium]